MHLAMFHRNPSTLVEHHKITNPSNKLILHSGGSRIFRKMRKCKKMKEFGHRGCATGAPLNPPLVDLQISGLMIMFSQMCVK